LYLFIQLNKISPNPFAAFTTAWMINTAYAPARKDLLKSPDKPSSLNHKGTSKRNLQDATADDAARSYLLSNNKEKVKM
jgi:hypothetical protein